MPSFFYRKAAFLCLATSINRPFLRFMLRMCPSPPSCRVGVSHLTLSQLHPFFLTVTFDYLAVMKTHGRFHGNSVRVPDCIPRAWIPGHCLALCFVFAPGVQEGSDLHGFPTNVTVLSFLVAILTSVGSLRVFDCTSLMRSYCKRWYLQSDNHRNCFVEYLFFFFNCKMLLCGVFTVVSVSHSLRCWLL